jgi:hypothetical protein
MQRAEPLPLPGTLHELARVMSHAMPQPLQLLNEGLVRPSVFVGTVRSRQLVPQQRCDEEHDGLQLPTGPLSGRVTTDASQGTPHIPHARGTQSPLQHISAEVHVAPPHEPGPLLFAQPASAMANANDKEKNRDAYIIASPSKKAPQPTPSGARPEGSDHICGERSHDAKRVQKQDS